jgi:type IV secretory pathway protease TraF
VAAEAEAEAVVFAVAVAASIAAAAVASMAAGAMAEVTASTARRWLLVRAAGGPLTAGAFAGIEIGSIAVA